MSLGDIFGAQGFNAAENFEEESTGFQLLPDIKDAVVGITNAETISNDAGWQGLKLELNIMNDGAWAGQYVGKTANHVITLDNPNFPDGAVWGRQELARWATFSGIQTLSDESQFVGKQVMLDVGRKVNKKKTKAEKELNANAEAVFDQTFTKLKAIGSTSPVAQAPIQQQAPQQQAPQQQFAQQAQQQAANPFANTNM